MRSVYERKKWENMPEALHVVALNDIRNEMGKDYETGEPKRQKRVIWESNIVGSSDGKHLTISQWCNDTFAPKSTLRAIATALNQGRDPGDEIDWDDFIGRQAQILVKHYQDENGQTKAKVRAVLRLPTPTDAAEEQRINAVVAKVKADAAQPRSTPTTQPPPTGDATSFEVNDADVPF